MEKLMFLFPVMGLIWILIPLRWYVKKRIGRIGLVTYALGGVIVLATIEALVIG